ncbi:MAG TPA: 50S ribosomal protein L23 [Candidatus Syntrophosphaera sp.]|jgi:large subunit ribosomal protein L23|nr:50S ribosomal protein L23 [Candidatus Cloacimonadota bacterium]OQB92572.1 MAG: 50S ribosomal protein L23 [Candidatus Cloacimonetes bacterium ADurb.Bin117]HNU54263.1 50S ribosomal protein L23 [Candidatus Syntrophosphaera sp.]MDI9525080.1 50S ribosomal protein L23 [Candidatus Cloacimonadota bacterium]NLH93323.1 50S ribosomal protein L23 [Candidatus Cloacimonadota bacterium]
MIHPRNIIISPIITEKSSNQIERTNTYSFKVSINANKIEIKHAIEKIFSVKVLDVNTIRMLGKPKRLGRYSGKRPDWKKAIVTLRDGDKIAEFEA